MKLQSFKILMFILIKVLFSNASFVYAETAEEYWNIGNVYYDQGNSVQAISDFSKAIEINPKYAEAYYNRGYIYYKQDEFTQANSDLTKAIAINPNLVEDYGKLLDKQVFGISVHK